MNRWSFWKCPYLISRRILQLNSPNDLIFGSQSPTLHRRLQLSSIMVFIIRIFTVTPILIHMLNIISECPRKLTPIFIALLAMQFYHLRLNRSMLTLTQTQLMATLGIPSTNIQTHPIKRTRGLGPGETFSVEGKASHVIT